MKSMELDDDDKIDSYPIESVRPDFPYGLRICLSEKEFHKLGLDADVAVVGGICHGHFMARITSVSAEDRGDMKSCRVEMQIEDLEIESEDEENEES